MRADTRDATEVRCVRSLPRHVLTRVKLRVQASSLGPMTSHDEQARCLADAVAAVKKNAYFMRKATVRRTLRNWLHAPSQRAHAMDVPCSETSQASHLQYSVLHSRRGTMSSCNVALGHLQDGDNLKDALRYAAALLGELRTGELQPHRYFELYMQVMHSTSSGSCTSHLLHGRCNCRGAAV
jgi:Vacuolar protein sorting-associated protein 35